MKNYTQPAKATIVNAQPGKLSGISTYKGSLEAPEGRDTAAPLSQVELAATAPEEIAAYIYDISATEYEGNDIRVCAVAGVLEADGSWKFSIKNAK